MHFRWWSGLPASCNKLMGFKSAPPHQWWCAVPLLSRAVRRWNITDMICDGGQDKTCHRIWLISRNTKLTAAAARKWQMLSLQLISWGEGDLFCEVSFPSHPVASCHNWSASYHCGGLSHATTLVTQPGTTVWTSIIIARSVGVEEEETMFPKVFSPLLTVNPQLWFQVATQTTLSTVTLCSQLNGPRVWI